MNERQKLGSEKGGLNGRKWVLAKTREGLLSTRIRRYAQNAGRSVFTGSGRSGGAGLSHESRSHVNKWQNLGSEQEPPNGGLSVLAAPASRTCVARRAAQYCFANCD